MQTCDPLKARQWFKLRTATNWTIIIVAFVSLVFVLQNLLPPIIADAIAIALAFAVFFYYLEKRSIGIECPACHQHIETNTAWVCGFCKEMTVRTDEFPFIGRCEHEECGQEPKAYKCHHCGELIFFTNDKLKINYATCANAQVEVKSEPVGKDPTADKVRQQQDEKRDLQHELELTRLKGDLKEAKSKIKPPPAKKTAFEELEEYYKSSVGSEDAAKKWKTAIDEEFKDDPVEREKRHRVVDQWVRNRM